MDQYPSFSLSICLSITGITQWKPYHTSKTTVCIYTKFCSEHFKAYTIETLGYAFGGVDEMWSCYRMNIDSSGEGRAAVRFQNMR